MRRKRSEGQGLKPIWKSLGFWMGAFVALFLAWGWMDSRRTWTLISTPGFGISSNQGRLEVMRLPLFRSFNVERLPTAPLLDDIPILRKLFLPSPAKASVHFDPETGEFGARFSHARTLATWTLLWLGGLLLWRRWFAKRRAKH